MTFLFLTFFTFSAAVAQSSVDSSDLQRALAPLDFSEVTTGLLFEKSPQFTNPDYHKGIILTDSNLVEINSYGFTYFTILGMPTTNTYSPLPHPNQSYMGYVNGNLGNPNEVNLALMYFQYNRMKEDGLAQGLFTYDGLRFHDVANRPTTPYYIENMLIGASTTQISNSKEVTFRFPSDLFHSNVADSISEIRFDYDDGNGFVKTNLGDTHTVSYLEDGRKKIKIRLLLTNGTYLFAHFAFLVETPVASKFNNENSFTEVFLPNGHPGGVATVFLNCDGILDKPLLVLDGFDQNNSRGSKALLEMLDFRGPAVVGDLNSILTDEGYDIIFIDYKDATANLRDNAKFVEEVIMWINEQKQESPRYSNIILAPSMGSPISKYALLSMEARGIDHEVEKLIGIDGAFRGGNVPLGLQSAVNELANFEVAGFTLVESAPILLDFETIFNRPAVKQLLFHHAWSNDNESPMPDHDDFFNELNSFSPPNSFEIIAISCGSINGIQQAISSNQTLLSGSGNLTSLINGILVSLQDFLRKEFVQLFPSPLSQMYPNLPTLIATTAINAPVFPPNSINATGTGFIRTMPSGENTVFKLSVSVPIQSNHVAVGIMSSKVKDGDMIDSSPGGMQDFVTAISALPAAGGLLTVVSTPHTNFIPTLSSLDLDSKDWASPPSSAGPMVSRFTGSVDASISPSFMAPGQVNQLHSPGINNSNIAFLLNELLTTDELSTPNTEYISGIYNFGKSLAPVSNPGVGFWTTRNFIDYNITVSGQNQAIWVCRFGRIGKVFNNTNRTNDVNTFDVIIKKGNTCDGKTGPIIVRLENGGNMLVGQWDAAAQKKGHVFVMEDATVAIDNGSMVTVNKESSLNIRSGGKVEVNQGGILQANFGGEIFIDNGGTLIVRNGAIFRLSHNSFAELSEGGKIIIEEGAKIQLWDGAAPDGRAKIMVKGTWVVEGKIDYSGNGYFEVFPSNQLELPNRLFEINGMGADFKLLLLRENTRIHTQDARFQITNALIHYKTSASISGAKPGNEMIFSNCLFQGENHTSAAIMTNLGNKIVVTNSKFHKLNYGILISYLDAIGFYSFVEGCTFEDNRIGIFIERSNTLKVYNSVFNASTSGEYAIRAFNVPDIRFTGSESFNYLNYQKQPSIFLSDVDEFIMSGGSIHNNNIGIGCPAPGYANVRMFNKASISDNLQYGIWIEKGYASVQTGFRGSVTMDCATLSNNQIGGIVGENIVLDIDAYNHSNGDLMALRSNTFQCAPNGKLFSICYSTRIPRGILARGNYWGTHNGNIEMVINQLHNLSAATSPGLGCTTPNVDVNVQFKSLNAPTLCPIGNTPSDPNGESRGCNDIEVVSNDGLGDTASEQYQTAYTSYFNAVQDEESTTDARMKFQSLSDVSTEKRDGGSTLCQFYVDIAKIMVEGLELPNDGYRSSTFGFNKPSPSSSFDWKMFPNPAQDMVQFQGLEDDQSLSIVNHLGAEVAQYSLTKGDLSISLTDMPSGIYFVKVCGMDTITCTTKRLVIIK